MKAPANETSVLEWGWAGRGLETPSGDRHFVFAFPGGALVALLDGLGHGEEAALASARAAPVLEQYASEPLIALVVRCHEALRGTRGAAMSVASFVARESALTWIGVGNVEAMLVRAKRRSDQRDQAICTRGGVVGYQLPPLRADRVAVATGDTLVMATDGVRMPLVADVALEHPPQEVAESILAHFGKTDDDAHVVVARFHPEAG